MGKGKCSIFRITDRPIRWLVDDCVKFVEREIRRGNHYDAIIMDPPSYGRGPKGEIWKIEEMIHPLINYVQRFCPMIHYSSLSTPIQQVLHLQF